jgi:Zn-dependent protease with chaperone function
MRTGNDVKIRIAARAAWYGLAFLLLAGIASAALGQTRLWPVARIADHAEPTVSLRDSRGNAVASVSRDLMRQLLVVQDRMQQQAGFAGELVISDGRAPNAFATELRGRKIIGITAPMLGLLGDDLDAYAALVGHEVAHHVRRHGQQRRERQQSLGLAGAIFGVALGAAGVRHAGTIADFGTLMVSLSYTRDEETEADRLGVDWMAAAGFDPNGALRLQERLLQAGHGMPIPFLRTHPSGEERLARIQQQIAGLAPAVNAAVPVIEAAAPVIETGTPHGAAFNPAAQAMDSEAPQPSAFDTAARAMDAQASQSVWPPPNWLPVVAPAEEPAIAVPVEFAASNRPE